MSHAPAFKTCAVPSCKNAAVPGSVLCAECKGELAPKKEVPRCERPPAGKSLARPIIGMGLRAQAHQLPEHLVPQEESDAVPGKKKRVAHNRLPRKQVQCPCGVVFEVPVGGHRPNIQFHSNECKKKYFRPPGREKKWDFTPEIDERIREVYASAAGMSRNHPMRDLADELGIPRWMITRRAIALGITSRAKKDPNWCHEEIRILKEYAHMSPETIRRHLKASGFSRSIVAIVLKKKRIGGETLVRGYSCSEAAKLFGVDDHCVASWIRGGLLQAERRNTSRSQHQGGDIYFIRPESVRLFVIKNVSIIDFRKLDKFWIVELLTKTRWDERRPSHGQR